MADAATGSSNPASRLSLEVKPSTAPSVLSPKEGPRDRLQKPSRTNSTLGNFVPRRTHSSVGAAQGKAGSGRPGTCTPEQARILAAFRQRLHDENVLEENDSLGTDDATLLRFLRARQFKLEKSLAMIKATKRWRASVGHGKGMDDLYESQVDPFAYPEREAVSKYWPLCFHGVDKQGNPINIQRLGAIDLKGLYTEVSAERHWEIFNACCEALPRECMPACAEAAKRNIEGAFCIVDLAGFGAYKFWGFRSAVQKCFEISQGNYPETVVKIVVVNAPSGFGSIFRAIKPWLAPETARKFAITSGKEHEALLLADIDASQLPAMFGGDCTCADKGGCLYSNVGPWTDVRREKGVAWARKGRFRNGQIDAINTPKVEDGTKRLAAQRTSTVDATADLARAATEAEDERAALATAAAAADAPVANGHVRHSWGVHSLSGKVSGLFGKSGSSEALRKDKSRSTSSLRKDVDAKTPESHTESDNSMPRTLPDIKPDPLQGRVMKHLDSSGNVVRELAQPHAVPAPAAVAA